LTNWDAMTAPRFIGFKNYAHLFSQDPLFWHSLRVSLTYSFFSIPLGIVVGLGLAILLNQKVAGLAFWRTLYYLPSVVSGVAVAILWLTLFNPDHGLFNLFLGHLGIQHPPLWLNSSGWALPSLLIMGLWGAGGSMILYLAGLQSVPTELYEAADIDGAGAWSKFWHITLPMISPVLFFNVIMGLIGELQIFTQPQIMTNGGPDNATLFYALYLYRQAFRYYHMGYAGAMAWILFSIILLLTLLFIRGSKSRIYYGGG